MSLRPPRAASPTRRGKQSGRLDAVLRAGRQERDRQLEVGAGGGALAIVPQTAPAVIPDGPPLADGRGGLGPSQTPAGRETYDSGVLPKEVEDEAWGGGTYTGTVIDGVPNGQGEFALRAEPKVGMSPNGAAIAKIVSALAALALHALRPP